MAILSKIRDRSVALIAVIGLALFAFVLDPSTLTDFFNSTKINEIGEVDGETISRQEFAEAIDAYRTNTNNRVSEMQSARVVWDNLLREKIYTKQLEKAGITIGENDVWQNLISFQGIRSNPQFQNEAGLFDEGKLKQFLKDAQESEDQSQWKAWSNYLVQIEANLKRDTYNRLIGAGLGASLKEAELQYLEENTKYNADFVYVPYSFIPDSLVTITKGDIQNYINENPKKFETEATRNISYVKFDIVATEKDKENIKKTVAAQLEDRKEYSSVTKGEVTIQGFKNTNNYAQFFDEAKSDIPLSEKFVMKNQIPKAIQDQVLNGKVGDIFGPYEDAGFFKLSKIEAVKTRPDSVKSSHILIPFLGSLSANATTTKTEEQAKKSADSILKLVRNNKKKFNEVADEINTDGSKGKGGDIGWTTHSVGFSQQFDTDYANFIFDNKEGKVDVVKSKFGFHIIRIDEAKNSQKAVQLITYGRKIEPSQETENNVFQQAETFALDLSNTNDIVASSKDKNYAIKPAVGLKVLDENIPGLGSQRQIVTWSFDSDVKVGDFKRFDIENGYVVATLTAAFDKGLETPAKANSKVRPILVKQKKAALLHDKMNFSSLSDIAKANNTSVRKMSGVALRSPSISGVGFEPKVIGAMMYAQSNELYNHVEGDRGVFAFVVTKKELPTALPNYETNRKRLADTRSNKTAAIFNALKDASNVEDYRATFYGINQ